MKVATYNVRNLFLNGEGENKSHTELRALRRMIALVDADVLMLQEVGSAASLERLNESLAAPYPYARMRPGNSDRSIHLAVLSRFEVRLHSHVEEILRDVEGLPLSGFADEAAAQRQEVTPLRLNRDVLRVDLAAHPISFFGVHLKSRSERRWQSVSAVTIRSAEVRVLSRLVREFVSAAPQRWPVLLGDFNDTPSSDALAPLRGAYVDVFADRLRGTRTRPSTYWPKRRMRIDQIYVPAGAMHRVTEPTIHAGSMAQQASDHYPVSCQLQL